MFAGISSIEETVTFLLNPISDLMVGGGGWIPFLSYLFMYAEGLNQHISFLYEKSNFITFLHAFIYMTSCDIKMIVLLRQRQQLPN